MAQTLINGEAHSWSQITINLLGRKVAGVTAINYTETQAIENNYGAGNYPVSRGYGNVEYTASITLNAEEVEALQDAVPSGRLQDIPETDIVVAYIPKGSTQIRTHILRAAKMTDNKREVNQGDTSIPVEIPLIIAGINWKA